ncbi:MAG: exo-alpha-sialidase, partial [Candidatus Omnitrophica bacterium]|nr:exo-alpha-sialidase [Candidatus Omnitrophota bacterium]
GLLVWGLMVQCVVAMGQETDRWSAPRNIVPPNIEAREARLVILNDGSLNVTFRGADIESPEIGGIFYTKSTDRGYSWSKPEPVISVPGIQSVTHQIESEGTTLLLFVTVFRPPNFEIVQFVSPNGGRTWSETDTVFAETEPVRAIHSWQMGGRLFLLLYTERVRTGNESEFSFYIVRGRGSGAYWDPPVKLHNVYASSIAASRLVDNGQGRMPSLYFRQNGFEDHLLENTSENYETWRDRPITSPPVGREFRQTDGGIAFKVEATPGRQILFNRTDNSPPQTKLITPVPSAISKPTLKIVWEGSDNYTLPDALRYELQMDEQAAFIVSDATNYQFDSLINGQHRLTIMAIDEAENRQVPPTVERFEVK